MVMKREEEMTEGTMLTLSGLRSQEVTEATATKLIELREVQRDLVDKLWTKRIEIERVIFMIEDATFAELLQRKYIRLQKWEDVAADMKFDSRYIYKLHGKALVEVEKIIRKRKRT